MPEIDVVYENWRPEIGSDRKGYWTQTYLGVPYWTCDPRPEDVWLGDIAHHLSIENRYGGASIVPYSVAQHSVECCYRASLDARAWLLFHDAEEAYTKDLPRPIKAAIPQFKAIGELNRQAIAQRLGLPWPIPEAIQAEIHEIDNRMLATERRDLLRPSKLEWQLKHEPYAERLQAWSWDKAETFFLSTARSVLNQDLFSACLYPADTQLV